MKKVLISIFLLTLSFSATADFDYKLKPTEIAEDTYIFLGLDEDFTWDNGGNIVNTGFIVTEEGVVVIDVGPSRLYGEQMRAAISEVTDKKIVKVILTHQHPDHFLGMQAFRDVPVYANPETIEILKIQAGAYLDNMYRLVGSGMTGTELFITQILPHTVDSEKFGDHKLEYIKLVGHTESDLLVFDKTTGVLFAGDQVFHNRALTTPHAIPEKWQEALEVIAELDYKLIVPGHGAVSTEITPVEQTREYLSWVASTISTGFEEGLDMNEILETEIPERFKHIALTKEEFARSVSHLLERYENQIFN